MEIGKKYGRKGKRTVSCLHSGNPSHAVRHNSRMWTTASSSCSRDKTTLWLIYNSVAVEWLKPVTRQTWQNWRALLRLRAWIETWLSLSLLVSLLCMSVFSSVLASFCWLDTRWGCLRKCLLQIDLCASLLGILVINCWYGRVASPTVGGTIPCLWT